MIKRFTNEHIIMQNKIKWKNLPGKDKREIYRMFIEEYNKKFGTLLEYKFIDQFFVDYITERVYYIDKNGNKYYIYHKNDFGRRIKTPYFKKEYKKRVDREGWNKNDYFYGYDEKPPIILIKLSSDEDGTLYQLKNSRYKRCLVKFENNEIKEIIVMKNGFRKDNKLDFKYKAKLSKRNKLYNEIKNKILQNV